MWDGFGADFGERPYEGGEFGEQYGSHAGGGKRKARGWQKGGQAVEVA